MKREHPPATTKYRTMTGERPSIVPTWLMPNRTRLTAKRSPLAAWRARSLRLKLLDYMKFFLLIPPAFGWTLIFMSLAGVGSLERVVASTPGTVEALALFGCPLLAVMFGLRALTEGRRAGARVVAWCWLTTGAGVLLFVFGVLVVLKT